MPSSLFSFSILFLVFLIRPFTSFVLVPSPSSFFLLPFLVFSFLVLPPCTPLLSFSTLFSSFLLAFASSSSFFLPTFCSSFPFPVLLCSELLFLLPRYFFLIFVPPCFLLFLAFPFSFASSLFLSLACSPLALHFLPAPCSCWLLKSRCFLEPRYPVSPSGWVSRLVETGHCDSSNNTCGSIMINLQNERESED